VTAVLGWRGVRYWGRLRAARHLVARLVRGDIDHGKPFLLRSACQTLVERDHFQRGWTLFGGNEGCRELQRIGGSQRVHPRKPRRRFTDDIARVDLVPAGGELLEPIKGKQGHLRIERSVAFEAREG
jgi:hypothetical protein